MHQELLVNSSWTPEKIYKTQMREVTGYHRGRDDAGLGGCLKQHKALYTHRLGMLASIPRGPSISIG